MFSRSKELRRNDKFKKPYEEGIPKGMAEFNYTQLFKDSSTKEKTRKRGSIMHRSIHNYHISMIIEYLLNETNGTVSNRCLGRSSYETKDKIFNFIAVNFPDLMRKIPNLLHKFGIEKKIKNLAEFTKIWNQSIDDIQNYVKSVSNSTPISNENQEDIINIDSENLLSSPNSSGTFDFYDESFDESNTFFDTFDDF